MKRNNYLAGALAIMGALVFAPAPAIGFKAPLTSTVSKSRRNTLGASGGVAKYRAKGKRHNPRTYTRG